MPRQVVKKAICQFCGSGCRVLVHSENGHMTMIEPDSSHPMAGQIWPPTKACLRHHGTREWFYHPDRVNFPLQRAGERGEAKWKMISWKEALDGIAQKMTAIKERYGAEAIAGSSGTRRTQDEFLARFFVTLGTPNWGGPNSVCYSPNVVTNTAMYGWPPRSRFTWSTGTDQLAAASRTPTRCMLLIGINPEQSRERLWKNVRDCKNVGGKIIVIDPRKTETAKLADVWLQLRPGTDTALLLAMINVVIAEGIYDKEFVEKWCYGFDQLAARASEYPPEKADEITWVPAEKIREAARLYATTKPAISIHGMGIEQLSNSIDAIQAKMSLPAICGNVDVSGGELIPGPASDFVDVAEMSLMEVLPLEQRAKQLSPRFRFIGFPGWEMIQDHTEKLWGKRCATPRNDAGGHLPSILRAIITGKPYPVRALFSIANNPMVTQANTKMVYRALKSLDLYVVSDYWLTPSAELADYVLPVASWLERPFLYSIGCGVDTGLTAGEQALPASIPGEYDHKNDYEIFRELALRLGLGHFWPWQTLEESFDYRLKPRGLTFKEFIARGGYDFPFTPEKRYEKQGFATATGKVELYSTVLEELGYDPMPAYVEPHESPVSTPELAKEYPLILITGARFRWMHHSEQRNVGTVRSKHPEPLVEMHPETAANLGIKDGDWVWIETKRGRIRQKCKYFAGILPQVVSAEHGWWFPELPGEEPWLHGVWESNVSVLVDDDPDVCNPKGGTWPLRAMLCRVYKTKTY